jgi:hypothetical protein
MTSRRPNRLKFSRCHYWLKLAGGGVYFSVTKNIGEKKVFFVGLGIEMDCSFLLSEELELFEPGVNVIEKIQQADFA